MGTSPRPSRVRLVVATLCVGVVLLGAALATVLSQSDLRRTGMNRVRATAELGSLQSGQTLCQRGELVPDGTGAIEVSLQSPPEGGSALRVAVIAGGATVARGAAPAGWQGRTLTIPLRPVFAHDTPARVCATAAGGGLVGLAGEAAAEGRGRGRGRATIGRRALGGELRIVYLRPHAESWWAAIGRVTDRMDVGHPLGGTAIAVLVALLLVASAALAAWQLTRADP